MRACFPTSAGASKASADEKPLDALQSSVLRRNIYGMDHLASSWLGMSRSLVYSVISTSQDDPEAMHNLPVDSVFRSASTAIVFMSRFARAIGSMVRVDDKRASGVSSDCSSHTIGNLPAIFPWAITMKIRFFLFFVLISLSPRLKPRKTAKADSSQRSCPRDSRFRASWSTRTRTLRSAFSTRTSISARPIPRTSATSASTRRKRGNLGAEFFSIWVDPETNQGHYRPPHVRSDRFGV